jgi:U3 small nucleolar RNA-associated protein 11
MDIVKVLKTQDENYIRTMRTAGLKVCIDHRQTIDILLGHRNAENRQN